MAVETVKIINPETGAVATVDRQSFELVWSARGWVLEDQSTTTTEVDEEVSLDLSGQNGISSGPFAETASRSLGQEQPPARAVPQAIKES